ncbi:MAG: hypothetical protein ACREH8_01825 [Opitutaceae bacterium]
MSPLFYAAAALALSAIAVTVYALLSAPDGYEDEEGFHSIEEKTSQRPDAAGDGGHGAGVRTLYSAQ